MKTSKTNEKKKAAKNNIKIDLLFLHKVKGSQDRYSLYCSSPENSSYRYVWQKHVH